MIRYRCAQCGAILESAASMAGKKDTCPLCGYDCSVPMLQKRWRLMFLVCGGVAVVLVIGVWLGFRILNPYGQAPGDLYPDLRSDKAKPANWPFRASVPNGLKPAEHTDWRGRKLWVAYGKGFGEAMETVIVVRWATQENEGDVFRAWYWAAEKCVGQPIGQSKPSNELEQEIAKTGRAYFRACTLTAFPDVDIVLPPQIETKDKEKSRLDIPGGPVYVRVPTFPREHELSMVDLDKPQGFAPCSVAVCASDVAATSLIVSWAGPSTDRDRGERLVAELSMALRTEPDYAWSPYDNALPAGFKVHKVQKHGKHRIWVFHGRQDGQVRDTLLALQWTNSKADLPHALGATWAAELALNRPLSDSTDGNVIKSCTVLARGEDGQFATRAYKNAISTTELLALGHSEGGTPRVLMHAGTHNGMYLSAVSRTVAFGQVLSVRHFVFAGAADGTPDGFWRIARALDEFASAWTKEDRSSPYMTVRE
jgi:hypothetical protein